MEEGIQTLTDEIPELEVIEENVQTNDDESWSTGLQQEGGSCSGECHWLKHSQRTRKT